MLKSQIEFLFERRYVIHNIWQTILLSTYFYYLFTIFINSK